ncbi:hypothetical protein Zmor_012659 [Zophobas morio]|uniref:Uncharacterized protein n=1 Tax=Zophobas morio TaxID=2755281 RepID=A0AA38MDZ8_9CUCU|nr:hypothetical protein Zmor_012659 [Zophobas morio]
MKTTPIQLTFFQEPQRPQAPPPYRAFKNRSPLPHAALSTLMKAQIESGFLRYAKSGHKNPRMWKFRVPQSLRLRHNPSNLPNKNRPTFSQDEILRFLSQDHVIPLSRGARTGSWM